MGWIHGPYWFKCFKEQGVKDMKEGRHWRTANKLSVSLDLHVRS